MLDSLCMGRCLIYDRRVSGLLSVVRETANSLSLLSSITYLANIPLSNWNWLGGSRRVAPRNKDRIACRPTIDFRAFSIAISFHQLHSLVLRRSSTTSSTVLLSVSQRNRNTVNCRYNDWRSLPYPCRHWRKEEGDVRLGWYMITQLVLRGICWQNSQFRY